MSGQGEGRVVASYYYINNVQFTYYSVLENYEPSIQERDSKENWCSRKVRVAKEGIQKTFEGKAKLPTEIAIGVLLMAGIVLGLFYFNKLGPVNSGTTFYHNAAVGAGVVLGLTTFVCLAVWKLQRSCCPSG